MDLVGVKVSPGSLSGTCGFLVLLACPMHLVIQVLDKTPGACPLPHPIRPDLQKKIIREVESPVTTDKTMGLNSA